MTRKRRIARRLGRVARAAWLGSLLCGLAPVLHPSEARAQSQEDLEVARSLFREGLSLEAAGNWAGALSKFQAVGRVKLTPQVRFHIARCQENLGRLNEALGEYRLAEYEASQQELAELDSITAARKDLEARVPRVVIQRGDGAEGSRIRLDSVELGERQIGAPVAVDPGPHHVVARLPSGSEFEQTFNAVEGETSEVVLEPPEGLPVAPAEASPAAASDRGADTGPAESGPGVLPWIVGGVGVAGLAASGVFFILRNGAESELDDTCRGSVCPESVQDTQDKGELYTTLSMVSLGVGVAGLGAATVLFLTSGSSDAAADARLPVDVDVTASARQAGVSVSGRF